MTEIRPIKESEAEAFLSLLCKVFELDFNLAYDIFFTEPMFDLNRKWAIIEGQEIVSVLTTTPLEFGWGKAVGIAGVATHPDRRNEGYGRRLIERVLRDSERAGEEAAMLFATDLRLYESLGFEGLDRVVRGPITSLPLEVDLPTYDFAELRARYDAWASEHPDRLRRDDRRWRYWQWNYRDSMAFGDGYLSLENETVREVLNTSLLKKWPVPRGTEWLGTSFMTDQLEVPLGAVNVPMYLMGRNVPGQPQFFMTDQF